MYELKQPNLPSGCWPLSLKASLLVGQCVVAVLLLCSKSGSLVQPLRNSSRSTPACCSVYSRGPEDIMLHSATSTQCYGMPPLWSTHVSLMTTVHRALHGYYIHELLWHLNPKPPSSTDIGIISGIIDHGDGCNNISGNG